MPTYIDIEPAVLRWQAKHGRRLTYEELAERANISIAALYRIKKGDLIAPDLRKINRLCKVLECDPGELIVRAETGRMDELTKLEVERRRILNEEKEKASKRSDDTASAG